MMYRRLRIAVIILVGWLCVLGVPRLVQAASGAACGGSSGGFLGFPTWYKYLEPSFEGGACHINVEFPDSLPPILLAVFEILLRVGGVAAVFFITWGGFQYLTSLGEPDKTQAGRSTVINALIGLLIMIVATAVVNLIGNNL